jgi:hypothetical protein
MLEAPLHQVRCGKAPDRRFVDHDDGEPGKGSDVDHRKASTADQVGMLLADVMRDNTVSLPGVEPAPVVSLVVVMVDEPRPVLAHVAADARENASPRRSDRLDDDRDASPLGGGKARLRLEGRPCHFGRGPNFAILPPGVR